MNCIEMESCGLDWIRFGPIQLGWVVSPCIMLLHRTHSAQLNPINATASHSSPAHVNPVGLDWIELEWIGFEWILFDSIVLTWIAHYIGHNISQHTDSLVECIILLLKRLRSTMWFSAFPAHFTTRSRTIAGIHRQ